MDAGKQSNEDVLGHESPPSQALSVSTVDSHPFSLASTAGSVTVTATITKMSDDEVLYTLKLIILLEQ